MTRLSWLAAGTLLAAVGALAAPAAERDQSPKDSLERSSSPVFSFGLVADVQYCDAAPTATRYYQASLEKLRRCVQSWTSQPLAFVVQLGDLIDRDFESFDAVLPIFQQLSMPTHHVLGNHDYAVPDEKKAAVPTVLGMAKAYYEFASHGWRFLVLDGNDVSLSATREGSPERRAAERLLDRLKSQGRPNAQSYNGGIGEQQLQWLRGRLDAAEQRGERVTVFCHFPAFPPNQHNLWNDESVVDLISSHRNVAAYLCGHNHAGNYGLNNGVHYLTLPGMVDTADQNAYAAAEVYPDRIEIRGAGRTPSRTLRFSQ